MQEVISKYNDLQYSHEETAQICGVPIGFLRGAKACGAWFSNGRCTFQNICELYILRLCEEKGFKIKKLWRICLLEQPFRRNVRVLHIKPDGKIARQAESDTLKINCIEVAHLIDQKIEQLQIEGLNWRSTYDSDYLFKEKEKKKQKRNAQLKVLLQEFIAGRRFYDANTLQARAIDPPLLLADGGQFIPVEKFKQYCREKMNRQRLTLTDFFFKSKTKILKVALPNGQNRSVSFRQI